MYFLLLCISAVNRFQVRCLPRYDHRQVFHSSDSWISLSSRRFCSSGLLIVLAYYYPDETYYYILLMTLDIVSHWTQMYAYGSLLFSWHFLVLLLLVLPPTRIWPRTTSSSWDSITPTEFVSSLSAFLLKPSIFADTFLLRCKLVFSFFIL